MDTIPDSDLHDLYLDTIQRCTSALRQRSDEAIEHEIFRESDAGIQSFLHPTTLAKLQQAGFLDEESVVLSTKARTKFMELRITQWSSQDVKHAPEWGELFDLIDRIVSPIDESEQPES